MQKIQKLSGTLYKVSTILLVLAVFGVAFGILVQIVDLPGKLPGPTYAFQLISGLFSLALLWVLRQILGYMAQGQPFGSQVANNLSALAWIRIGLSAVELLVALCFADRLTTSLGAILSECLVAAMLFLLSLVFRYGAALQQQADETL